MEDFKFDIIGGKYVASTYFNSAFDNFYQTIIYVMTRSGIDAALLNKLDFKEEKVAKVLRLFYNITFGDNKDAEIEDLKKLITEKEFNEIKGKDKDHAKSDEEIKAQAVESANSFMKKCRNQLDMPNDILVRFHKLLFNKIPAFSPMMAEVVSHENNKNQKKLKDEKTSREEKEELRKAQKGLTFNKLFETVTLVAEALLYYRDFYTHKHPYNTLEEQTLQKERECKLFFLMKSVFDASRRKDKTRNLVTTKAMEDLTGNKNGQRKKKDGKRFIENDQFYFKIIGHEYNGENIKGYTLSEFGKLFFCCLFLSRHDILKFIEKEQLMKNSPFKLSEEQMAAKQLKEDERIDKENIERAKKRQKPLEHIVVKPEQSETNEIVKDMLCVFHIRQIRERRIDPQETRQTLTMDMLNELRKCPHELYESFSPEGKKQFEREVTPDEKNGTPEVAKMIRSTDRFPHLALRYIDQTESLGDIRFHVRLGRYRFCFYDKKCIDGKPDVRVWQKEINGFGLYQEIEEKRKTDWAELFQKSDERIVEQLYGEAELKQLEKDKAGQDPYITDSKTTYNIHANRIGMTWGLEDGIHFPSLDRSLYVVKNNDGSESERYKAPEKLVRMLPPKCNMSIYDLPALLFYLYLYSEYGKRYRLPDAATIIKNKYNGLVALFSSMGNGMTSDELNEIVAQYGLELSDLPDSLKPYLNQSYQTTNLTKSLADKRIEHAKNVLNQLLIKVEKRLDVYKKKEKKIDSGSNKIGSKSYEDIRHGTLARYLAKSLVKWQPTNDKGKDKLTGMNFNKLMSFLATYGEKSNLSDLNAILKEAYLSEGSNPHPFIINVLNTSPQNIENLYVSYLQEEKKTIIRLLKRLNYEKKLGDLGTYLHELETHVNNCRELSTENMVKRLAQSIFNWVDPSFDHNNLKNWLNQILYSADIMKIEKKLEIKGLLTDNVHPFLKRVITNSHNLRTLYSNYLIEEKAILDEIANVTMPVFVHLDAKKWELGNDDAVNYFEDSAKRHLKTDKTHDSIIMLPDGLFTRPIINLLTFLYNDENVNFGCKFPEDASQVRDNLKQMLEAKSNDDSETPLCHNVSYIIQSYFKDVMGDKNQPYYTMVNDFKRAYKPFTTLFGNNVGNTTEKEPYYMDADELKEKLNLNATELDNQIKLIKKRYKKMSFEEVRAAIKSQIKEVKKIERSIRRYKTQDVMLFLCAKKLLISILSDSEAGKDDAVANVKKKAEDLKLMNFNFDDGFTFLSQGDNGANLSYNFRYKNGIIITQQGLSLKNYGNIYRVLNDPRLKSLMDGLKKLGVKEVTFNDLTSELAIYDDKRPEIFRIIHEIEDKAFNANKDVFLNPNDIEFYVVYPNGTKKAKRNSFNEMVKMLKEYDDDDISIMIAIRNAAGHGHYVPDFNQLETSKGEKREVPNIANLMELTIIRRKDHQAKQKQEDKQ